MTWVLIGASPLDPIYPYRFPDSGLYTNEFAELCRQKCAEYLATSTVIVCEMADDQDPGRSRVVAFGSWDAPHIPTANTFGRGMHPQPTLESLIATSFPPLHANPTLPRTEPLSRPANNPVLPITIGHRDRMNVFRERCAASKRDMFDKRYTRGHMFLKILLCHPDYQRRGAGSALTSWGIEEGRRLGLNTTVFASPMGLRLYKKLGFREIGRFRVQLDGDDAFLEIPALVLPPDEGFSAARRVMHGEGMPLSVAAY